MGFDDSRHPHGTDPANRGRFSHARWDASDLTPGAHDVKDLNPDLVRVLEAAAELQEKVPDAVLVGGSAAALYAGHRASFDHDHVVQDLGDRYEVILDALEREPEWVTNRVRPGKIILGAIGDIEVGVRELVRTVPLETQEVLLPSGRTLRVPTAQETLRVKAFLIVKRNQTRDYLDVCALADRYGYGPAARTLSDIDRFYTDPDGGGTPVVDQLVRQLAEPRPQDSRVTGRLPTYKALAPRWQDWGTVVEVCRTLARRIVDEEWD